MLRTYETRYCTYTVSGPVKLKAIRSPISISWWNKYEPPEVTTCTTVEYQEFRYETMLEEYIHYYDKKGIYLFSSVITIKKDTPFYLGYNHHVDYRIFNDVSKLSKSEIKRLTKNTN